jgi:cytochrome c oxidase assembly protein subunit 15
MNGNNRQIALWLFACCVLVFAMVVLGGVTRLTGSGLSMVDWHPISGVVPPLSEAQWQAEFQNYQTSPEYQKINRGMSLAAFKSIFLFEYAHRVLGRAIGVAFLLPFVYFFVRRMLDRALLTRLAGVFVLGALQGLLGWYMVKSGLVDNPHVSQYRLTAHLALAVLIYGYMLWLGLQLWYEGEHHEAAPRRLRNTTLAVSALIVVTLLSGGFVAGLKAGLIYNTFPLMNGQWIPDGLLAVEPAILNLFENIVTVQFDHRLLAMTTLVAVLALWLYAIRQPLTGRMRTGFHLLAVLTCVQVGLGVATLLLRVPVSLGAAHQGAALLLLTVVVYVNQAVRQAR